MHSPDHLSMSWREACLSAHGVVLDQDASHLHMSMNGDNMADTERNRQADSSSRRASGMRRGVPCNSHVMH